MATTTTATPIVPQTVAALLPRLSDADPDHRFMSLNDLLQVLSAGKPDFLHTDYNVAARAVDGILRSLDDSNGEVQNLAIKWYAVSHLRVYQQANVYSLVPLVQKIPTTILPPLIEKLSNLDLTHSVDGSIPAMALRTVVTTLPRPISGVTPSKDVLESYSAISRVMIPRLIGRVVTGKKGANLPQPPPGMLELESGKEVDVEAVDVLIEVTRCFGPLLQETEVAAFQELLIRILEAKQASSQVKKRAVVAVSILAMYLTDDGLGAFISQLIESMRNPHLTLVQRRLYITILGSMARSISGRFGPYLKTLGPYILRALSAEELSDQLENAAEDGEPNQEIDDVREAALVALDGFLSSCGSEMRLYQEETIAALLRFLKYDPNYNVDDDEEMGGTQQDDDDMDEFDEDDDFEADAGFDDDDDDASWKVRRCAAKALYTLISTRGSGDLLEDGTLYQQVAPVLIQRFNEREENVRLEIISTMSSLVRKTGEGVMVDFSSNENLGYIGHVPQTRKRRRESSAAIFDSKAILSMSAGLVSPTIEPLPTSGPRADLARLTPNIIKVAAKLLKGTSIATKQALIKLLNDVVTVQHGGLGDFFGQILEPIVEAIKSTSSTSSASASGGGPASATPNTLRVAALHLIGDIASTHSSSVLQPYLSKIVPSVAVAVNDRYYKISSEAIGTVEQLVKALTPPRSMSMRQNHQGDLQALYKVILDRMSATDADVEVRERAIQALGILLARTATPEGSNLLSPADRTTAMNMLVERLKNETTRLATVHAVDTIAALATTKDGLQPAWIREVSLELSAQLRKSNRSLRGASLAALKNLILSPVTRNNLDAPTISGLTSALLPLLISVDLHLLGPALLVLSTLVADNAKLVVTTDLNKALCELLKSPLGGSTLEAVLSLVKNIGQNNVGQPLMAGLLKDVSIQGEPAVVGKVIGTLLVYGGPSVGVNVESFLTEVNNPGSDDARRCLALAVLGEAGLRLGVKSPLKASVFTAQFRTKSEKVPLAAAVALGRAGAGNIQAYLPEILSLMTSGGNAQYLLLHSIKEILQQASNNSTDISQYSKPIWDQLLGAAQPEDNKAVGAECIGRLAIIEPRTYIPQLTVCIISQLGGLLHSLILIRFTSTAPNPPFVLWLFKQSDIHYLIAMRSSMQS